MMTMGMDMRAMRTLSQIQVHEPMTASIFPQIDAMLEQTEYQKAVGFFPKGRYRVGRYASVLDFLFSELFDMQDYCFAFYREEGAPLRDILTPSQRAWCEHVLDGALRIAKAAMESDRRREWGWFKETALSSSNDEV
jgi:hypothetical protein